MYMWVTKAGYFLIDPFTDDPKWNVKNARTEYVANLKTSKKKNLKVFFDNTVYMNFYKQAIVEPLLKKPHLDASLPNSYRLISFMSKILEKTAAEHFKYCYGHFPVWFMQIALDWNGFT